MELDIQFQFWFFKSINSSYNSIYVNKYRIRSGFHSFELELMVSPVKLDTHPTVANPVFKNCQKLVDFYHHMSKAIQKIVFSYNIQAGGE